MSESCCSSIFVDQSFYRLFRCKNKAGLLCFVGFNNSDTPPSITQHYGLPIVWKRDAFNPSQPSMPDAKSPNWINVDFLKAFSSVSDKLFRDHVWLSYVYPASSLDNKKIIVLVTKCADYCPVSEEELPSNLVIAGNNYPTLIAEGHVQSV